MRRQTYGWAGLGAALAAMAVLAGAAAPGPVHAACQVPLFVQQFGVDANIMFLLDNSGSMNEAVYHADYNPAVTYAGRFTDDVIYYVSTTGLKTPRSFNTTWPSTPSATLVTSDAGQYGRYSGNYLNWIFFNATAAQRAAIPQVTRVKLMKTVVNNIVARSEQMRFGIADFQLEGPGTILATCGTSKTTIYSVVNGIAATTWTPTAESMETVVNYFKRTTAGPIQAGCQKNFLIVVTDGFPTHDLAVGIGDADGDHLDPGNCASIGAPDTYDSSMYCSHYMDDVAYYAAHTDLRPDLDGTQTLTSYTIGFMVNAPLLALTASKGGGLYYSANNSAELVYAFGKVMQDIVKRISSGSAVAVISTARAEGDRMFRGKFMPGTWEGFLESFAVPYTEGDEPVWESGALLGDRDPASRRIFTALGTTTYDFTTGEAATLRASLGVSTEDTASALISWTRGEEVLGFRDRGGWRLGDIISSTPVVIGPPSGFQEEEDYQAFLAANHDRRRVIYIGANDGMLHCFDADSGEELWAFIPQFALPKLRAVADSFYCHQYSVDQTVTARDVKIGDEWRTVLCEGGREGGASYFALDVTDPEAPEVLWQVTLPDGYAYSSEVEFATIGTTPVALMGSGLNAVTGQSWLYAYRLSDGALLGSSALSTVTGGRNRATRPRAVDTDLNGTTDVVYVGEAAGNLWRFGIGTGTTPSGWTKLRLFSDTLPITAPPVTATNANGQLNVYFGTGAYLTTADFGTTTQQYFYGIIDKDDGAALTRSNLMDQTSEAQALGSRPGWYVSLWNATGERVTEQAVVVAGAVIFTSYAPVMEVCTSGGHSWLYRLAYDTGGEVLDADGNVVSRDEDLGDGIASRPVVDIVNATAVIQSSDAGISQRDVGAAYDMMTVRAWRENFSSAEGVQ